MCGEGGGVGAGWGAGGGGVYRFSAHLPLPFSCSVVSASLPISQIFTARRVVKGRQSRRLPKAVVKGRQMARVQGEKSSSQVKGGP